MVFSLHRELLSAFHSQPQGTAVMQEPEHPSSPLPGLQVELLKKHLARRPRRQGWQQTRGVSLRDQPDLGEDQFSGYR